MWGIIYKQDRGINLHPDPEPRFRAHTIATLVVAALESITPVRFHITRFEYGGKSAWAIYAQNDLKPIVVITYPDKSEEQCLIEASKALLEFYDHNQPNSIWPKHAIELWEKLRFVLGMAMAEPEEPQVGWSSTAPTVPGMYWFHGWRNARYKSDHAAETGLARVFITSNNRPVYVLDGNFMYTSECEGKWLPAILPTPPEEK